ncbi:NAD-dependent dehydrogenase [Cutibacterium acnes JCM 18918]|nr:NAD-dependent dehydrogenase [Cutibacterium acnes JCM 18918]
MPALGRLMSNHLVNWLTPTKERRTFVTGEKVCSSRTL